MEFLLGLAVGLVGILVTIVVAAFQERKPSLTIQCNPPADGDPCALELDIANSGRGEARDVHVGFNWALPAQTSVFAPPELAAEIIEANVLPDPRILPAGAKLMKAFSIRIPRIQPKSSVQFSIRTVDPDNMRAARQVLRTRVHIQSVIRSIAARLKTPQPRRRRTLQY